MKNQHRVIELLAEMVKGQDKLVREVTSLKKEMTSIKEEAVKQALLLAENSRAILKLADEIRLVAEHEKRISRLELAVFK